MRGLAVLIMVEAHTFDAWTAPADRATPLYRVFILIGGFGAPAFLFLAGVALALAIGSRLRKGIESQVSDTFINGSLEHRLPGNLNISFAYVEGEAMLMALKDVAVSSGSACT